MRHMHCGYLLHAAIQAVVPAVNCISEYAVRVSWRIVAQIQDRVSTDWKWQVSPELVPDAAAELVLHCFSPVHACAA